MTMRTQSSPLAPAAPPLAAAAGPALAVRGLTKRFGDLVAADNLDVEFFRGEVHAVLGENGAGKSTFVKMLYGYYRPDSGETLIDGEPVRLDSPSAARAHGIGMVFQNFTLIPALTVAENVALIERSRGPLVRLGAVRARIEALAQRYNLAVNPDAYVRDLSVGERQRVEILKLLASDASILILDEPTSVLAPHEVSALLDTIRSLRADGYTLIIITHKMAEVFGCADRVTVLRRGRVAGGGPLDAFDEHSLISMMLGERGESLVDLTVPPGTAGEPGIELRDVDARIDGRVELQDIELLVRCGEIVGVAAVSGNGQAELAEVVLGTARVSRGSVLLGGRELTRASTAARLRAGLAIVPEDPMIHGSVGTMSVRENLMLTSAEYRGKGRFLLRPAQLAQSAREVASRSPFALPDGGRTLGTLSGGNVQRVVIAREVTDRTRYLIAYHPTRGLDAASARSVQELLVAARSRGCAVLLVTEDLEELMALSDQMVVMHGGRIVGRFERDGAGMLDIGRLMTGASAS